MNHVVWQQWNMKYVNVVFCFVVIYCRPLKVFAFNGNACLFINQHMRNNEICRYYFILFCQFIYTGQIKLLTGCFSAAEGMKKKDGRKLFSYVFINDGLPQVTSDLMLKLINKHRDKNIGWHWLWLFFALKSDVLVLSTANPHPCKATEGYRFLEYWRFGSLY